MYTCHECHCELEASEVEVIDEAGGGEYCERCAGEFWSLFFRAEAMAEGDR